MSHLDRRHFVRLIAASTAFGAFAERAVSQEGAELVVVATGGAFEKALKKFFCDPFTAATGIKVRPVAASNAETWTKLKAMQQTGSIDWDVVTAYPEDLVAQAALLAPIACGELKNLAGQAVPDACSDKGLLRTSGGVNIVYDKTKFAEGPKDWAEFWDVKKFPGPRAMPNAGAPWWPLLAALQADGVAKDKLFPPDLDRAFKKLEEIRPSVTVWWRTGDQSQQMFRSKEVSLAMMWSGRAYALKDEGLPLEVVWKGALPNTALWAIVKGSKNTDAARKFLDFYLASPDAHTQFAEAVNFDTSNRQAVAALPDDKRKTRATAPENAALLAPIDAKWVAENRNAVLDRWNRWLAS